MCRWFLHCSKLKTKFPSCTRVDSTTNLCCPPCLHRKPVFFSYSSGMCNLGTSFHILVIHYLTHLAHTSSHEVVKRIIGFMSVVTERVDDCMRPSATNLENVVLIITSDNTRSNIHSHPSINNRGSSSAWLYYRGLSLSLVSHEYGRLSRVLEGGWRVHCTANSWFILGVTGRRAFAQLCESLQTWQKSATLLSW